LINRQYRKPYASIDVESRTPFREKNDNIETKITVLNELNARLARTHLMTNFKTQLGSLYIEFESIQVESRATRLTRKFQAFSTLCMTYI
jgi:hypothetical protein